MNRIELSIALRYLMSRRAHRMPSLITLIAAGGVTVGIMVLVVVLGVMNGLQNDLRDKILVGSPHLMVLTFGRGLRIDDWPAKLDVIRQHPEVVAAAPFVRSQGLFSAGEDYAEGAVIIGLVSDTGDASVTTLAQHFTGGDLRFETTREDVDAGIVLGQRLAERLSAFPGSVVQVASPAGSRFNRAVGAVVPRYWFFEVTGTFETGMFEYDNSYAVLPFDRAQQFAGLD
ncbi:MAG: ABC transporter permease, partial [Gemmatimonadales bacterium]